ncbi:CRE-HLH-10 protein [Caenorhabditis remanei]|uniref:CRE-HLH-10 protein n=1 Tax=Caenorhabditis remanei TaxID=31234 RepID=E3MD89_CAERE|nr:CRE-HLH-10 protein [Caenorhabditis remanei]
MESSSTATAHQEAEEPLDLSLGNHGNSAMVDEQQQQYVVQFFDSLAKMVQQNLMAAMIQNLIESSSSSAATASTNQILEEPPEIQIDGKENMISVKNRIEENESTPSPTHDRRRTSTGKLDRRMVGKVTSRRVEANARERNRVQQLSRMFDELRVILPVEAEMKISKLSTLKVASAYIGYLGAIMKDDAVEEEQFRKKLLEETESAKTLRK